MSLREKLFRDSTSSGAGAVGIARNEETPAPAPTGRLTPRPATTGSLENGSGQTAFLDLKTRLHRSVINRLDLSKLNQLSQEQVRVEVSRMAKEMLANEDAPLSASEREKLIEEVEHELFGLGPLEPLLADPTISDILVNSATNIYIERRGKLERTSIAFKDDDHLMRVIERIVSRVGRRIDESSPMVDARLADGSRVNAIIPPLALRGPALSIRRFGTHPLRMNDLVEKGALTQEIADMLAACVKAKLNILISGGTGSGKTTLLNSLSAFIPEDERIVTIEDSAELQLQQPHIVALETRPPNLEGRGEITQRDLVRNALRMRPDRIVIGEVRQGEAIDMLQAMNTGHDGSLATVHANTPRDALVRLETMIQMTGMKLSDRAMRHQISSAINVVIQAARLTDGTRRVTSISEITGMEGESISMQEIFKYDRSGVDSQGRVIGRHRPTGVRPQFAERLKTYGYPLPRTMFEEK
ncbi:MAG: CpaF family protein [Acidobacteria bacterium]|nr:CpaF family protein [Acidobacteriota bacterium]MCW5971042.1 CpaF family protein [Blastocatellales bacterium]